MKKVLFAFEDADFKVLSTYESLGFTVEIDDAVNNIYYVEMDLSNYDMLSVLTVLDDCIQNNLRVAVNIDGTIYDSKWDIKEIDAMVAANPLMV